MSVAGVCVDRIDRSRPPVAGTAPRRGFVGICRGVARDRDRRAVANGSLQSTAAKPPPLGGVTLVAFTTADIGMHPTEIKNRHTNAMRFAVDFADGGSHEAMYYSIGGGFVCGASHPSRHAEAPWRTTTGDELLKW